MISPARAALAALLLLTGAEAAEAAGAGRCVATPATIIGDAQRIATPEGIDIREQVDVGDGNRQWISIRGRNRANPVLLVIHGGPGTPTMPISWAYQTPWEDFFTVVNWDQRGVGKNAPGADPVKLAASTSLDRVVVDGFAVVDHLRRTLGKDRIALLGFSWGTLVGVQMAARHPELFSVYAGVGQMGGNGWEEITRLETIEAARRAGDGEAVAALEALGPAKQGEAGLDLARIRTLRRFGQRYNGMWYGHDSLSVMNDVAGLSPDYDAAEIGAFARGAGWLADSRVLDDIARTDLAEVRRLRVPVVVLQGRYDLATHYAAAKRWVARLNAPRKRFVTFERSAHFVMLEEPGRFLQALIRDVLPLAGGAPAFAPAPRTRARGPGCTN